MSLLSFVARCLRDPSHFARRLHWEAWKWVEEREIAISSMHGQLICSSKDQIIGRALYLTGQFAISEIDTAFDILVREGLLQPAGNGMLLDIGANIGTTCVHLVGTKRFESALAFEPQRKNASFLEKNVRLNHLEERIRVFPIGLSSSEREAELMVSNSNFGDHRVKPVQEEALGVAASFGVGRELERIRLASLDSVITRQGIDPRQISLVWMDTQGHESQVLAGAQVLKSHSIPMVMEFWPEGLEGSGASLAEFCAELQARFVHYYDLQDVSQSRRPTSSLFGLAERLRVSRHYTDLILIP